MGVSRREFMCAAAAAAFVPARSSAAEVNGRGRLYPSVAARYPDPATEFTIVRLTDPQFDNYLPPAQNRPATPRALLYASNATGKWDAFRMDLKTRESRQLTDAAKLDPSSLAFLPGERGFCHFDNGVLFETLYSRVQAFKTREIYRSPSGFEKLPGISLSDDGRYAVIVEKAGESANTVEKANKRPIETVIANGTQNNGENSNATSGATHARVRLIDLMGGSARTLFEAGQEITAPSIRPHHPSLLFSLDKRFRVINFDGTGSRELPLGPGEASEVRWNADGHSMVYLNRPDDPKKLVTIREFVPESNENTEIGATTQYVCFHANTDASAFVGASGSKASPYLLLMARAAKRELTLAEHRASDAHMVAPVFSPNSQFVLFASDRHGKPAIYWIAVDKFVAETDAG